MSGYEIRMCRIETDKIENRLHSTIYDEKEDDEF
jgi:hypothetical protein